MTTKTELQTVVEVLPSNPMDLPTEMFTAGLDRRKQNRAALLGWVRNALVNSVDFGCIKIKGRMSRPSLWKPGAEKICGMLGVTIRYPSLKEYEQAAMKGATLKQIIIRCEILDRAGSVITDGVGARSLSQDNGDINKSLKMACKSAHIDATLRMAGLSEVFTQDIEDMGLEDKKPIPIKPMGITPQQHKRLEARINQLDIDRDRLKAWMLASSNGTITSFLQLTPQLYQKMYTRLDQFAGGTA